MSDAAQKAIETLLDVAENENQDGDTRIRAACAILDRLGAPGRGACAERSH